MSCYFCFGFRKDLKFYTIPVITFVVSLQRVPVSVKVHYKVLASHPPLPDVYCACVSRSTKNRKPYFSLWIPIVVDVVVRGDER